MRRTSGDERRRPLPDGGSGVIEETVLSAGVGTGVDCPSACCFAAGDTAGPLGAPGPPRLASPSAGPGLLRSSAPRTSSAWPMVATTVLTPTVSPSPTLMSVRMPAAGDGISASTLSVEISKSGSSRSTWSPTRLIQRTIVPSAIDSPIWGITTGVGIFLPSQMYRGSMRGVRGFADGLREGRVRVNRADELLHRAFEPQRQHRLGDQLRRSRPDHVNAEDLVVFPVGDDLHEPFALARHLRAAEDAEWERPDAHVVALLPGLGLRQSDAANLGIAIGAARHVVIVDRPHLLARNPFGDEDPFRCRDM